MTKYIFFSFFFVSTLLFSQHVEKNYHSNHKIFGVNKLKPKSTFFLYENPEVARSGDFEKSNRFITKWQVEI